MRGIKKGFNADWKENYVSITDVKIAAGDTKKRLTKPGRMTRNYADNPGKDSPPRLLVANGVFKTYLKTRN